MTAADLKYARNKLGMSVKDLSAAINITGRSIRRMEAGTQTITLRTALQVSNLLESTKP